MRKLTLMLLLVLVLPAPAQDAKNPGDAARELERRAGALLDEGKRAEALDLLAQAAKLRAEARAAKETPEAKPQRDEPAQKKPTARENADAALASMDAALQGGSMADVMRFGRQARAALGSWADELAAAEKRLVRPPPTPERLLGRVEALERQIEELKAMLRKPG